MHMEVIQLAKRAVNDELHNVEDFEVLPNLNPMLDNLDHWLRSIRLRRSLQSYDPTLHYIMLTDVNIYQWFNAHVLLKYIYIHMSIKVLQRELLKDKPTEG